jgi:uncharacterized protein (DUF2147 family)
MSLPRITLAMSACLVVATMAPAHAADPLGNWYTAEQKSKVQVAKCGDAICGTIVALKEPNDPKTGKPKIDDINADASKRTRPIVGTPIVLGMKPSGADKWTGQVYNPEDGKTYTGSLTMTGANTLKVEGCIMGGMLCKSNDWTRTN